LLAFELPFLELFELLGEFELFLAIGAVFIIFFTEELVETQQLLIEQSQFIFMVSNQIFIVPQLHDDYLLLLRLLP